MVEDILTKWSGLLFSQLKRSLAFNRNLFHFANSEPRKSAPPRRKVVTRVTAQTEE